MNEDDRKFLKHAIEKAAESVSAGGFPAGAVITRDGEIIGEGISVGNILNDPTSHGEMSAIRDACKNLQSSDLGSAVLYASMQPCIMCHSAAMWGSISKIFYACSKDRVDPAYYGGRYNSHELNTSFLKPIKLIHVKELEEESLRVLQRWEASRVMS